MKFFTRKKQTIFVLLFIFGTVIEGIPENTHGENANNILISEIRISGENASDEFIELYNPTGAGIDLKGWDLKKTAKTGSIENIVTNMEGIIPASGYFLIVPRANCGETKTEACYKGAVEKDAEYTTNNYLAKDNALSLYDQNGNLVDKAGWGASVEFEGEVFQDNPQDGQGLERRIAGGVMQDTGNNKNDFILKNEPIPKNTKSLPQDPVNEETVGQESQTGGQNQESMNQGSGTGGSISGSGTTSSSSSGSSAQSYITKIVITEFLPNPEDSDNDSEFIEIYNAGSGDENIGGWTVEDKMGKTGSYSIPENAILKPGEYRAFYSSETRIVLNNPGDGIILRNEKGEIRDGTPISDAAGEDVAYALDGDGHWVWTQKPTPGAKNIIEAEQEKTSAAKKISAGSVKEVDASEEITGYDYSDGIIITEMLPNPEGSDNKLNYEWIEIYNDSDKEVDLAGWMVDDIRGKGSMPYIIKESRRIKSHEYMVFSKEETNVILNNTEDEVSIIWPDGTVVDSISYKKPKEGFSYVLFDSGQWDWSSKPSPGKENILDGEIRPVGKRAEEASEEDYAAKEDDVPAPIDETEYPPEAGAVEFIEIDIESARKLPRFSNVKISGTVSVPPGTFQDNLFYISGSGIQIFSYSKIFGGIKLGDKVELFGRMSEVGGEKRLLVESPDYIKIISHDNLLDPKMISTGEVGEKYEGYLILIEGSVGTVDGNIFYVDDGSGDAKVYLKSETNIMKPDPKAGDMVNVTGIVSRTSLGYRVLPRFQNDVKIGKTSGVSSSENAVRDVVSLQNKGRKKDGMPFYYYGFMLAALVVLIDWGRMKTKK